MRSFKYPTPSRSHQSTRLLKTEPNPTTITTNMLTHTTGAYQKVIVSSICRDSTTNSQCRSDARQDRALAWQLYRYTLIRVWHMKSLSCRTPSLSAASDWEFLGLLVLSQRLLITTILNYLTVVMLLWRVQESWLEWWLRFDESGAWGLGGRAWLLLLLLLLLLLQQQL